MQKYTDVVTSSRSGAAKPSALVTVKTYPAGVTATIYSDDGVTTQDNPITTDSNGEFSFYAADGEYNLTVSGTGITERTIGPIILHDPADADDYMPSTDVSFTQSGTGAISRTAEAKLKERVSVFDFIPVALHAAISAGTSTTEVHTYIQAAIDAVSAAGGGVIYFPPGQYDLNKTGDSPDPASGGGAGIVPHIVGANDVTLEGAGWVTNLQLHAGSTNLRPMVGGVALERFHVKNMKITGVSSTTGTYKQTAVYLDGGPQNCSVTGCRVTTFPYDGILIEGTAGGQAAVDNVIAYNTVSHCGDDGINPGSAATRNVTGTIIAHNHVHDCTNTGIHVSIASSETTVVGNSVHDNGVGIDTVCTNVVVTGNVSYSNTSQAFKLSSAGSTSNAVVSANFFSGGSATANQSVVEIHSSNEDVLIANNYINASGVDFGISVQTGSARIIGNTIADADVRAINLSVSSTKNQVHDNYINNAGAIGICATFSPAGDKFISIMGNTIDGGCTSDGIFLGGCQKCKVVGNTVTGVAGNAIREASSSTGNIIQSNVVDATIVHLSGTIVRDNVGYGVDNDINTTAVGNLAASGTTEHTLMTYSLHASALVASGIRITAWGTTANNANPKTIKFYFGTSIHSTNLTVSQAGKWYIEALVFRTGASAQDYVVKLNEFGATSQTAMSNGSLAVTDTSAITIKCNVVLADGGAGINDNDIVQEGMLVEAVR